MITLIVDDSITVSVDGSAYSAAYNLASARFDVITAPERRPAPPPAVPDAVADCPEVARAVRDPRIGKQRRKASRPRWRQ